MARHNRQAYEYSQELMFKFDLDHDCKIVIKHEE